MDNEPITQPLHVPHHELMVPRCFLGGWGILPAPATSVWHIIKKKKPKKFTFTLANVLHLQGGFMGKGWYFHSNKGFFPENWWISKAQKLVQSPEVPGWKTKQMVNPLHFYFFRIIFFLPVILHFPPCPKCLLCNEFLICDGFKAVPSGVGNQQHQGLIWEGTGTPSCSENIRDFLYI